MSSSARTAGIVAGASLVFGAAAWASRAVLDEVVAGGARQRVALVPDWHVFLVFTLLGLLAAGGLHRALSRRRAAAPGSTLDVADLMLPVFGLALLLVPFLPGLPDRWPAVQALAGPAKWIVWAIVAGQCLWVAAPHAPMLRRWLDAAESDDAHRRRLAGHGGGRQHRRLAAHPHHALPVGRRAALSGDRAEPVA